MSQSQNLTSLSLTQKDSSGNTLVTRSVSLTVDAAAGQFSIEAITSTAAVTVTLPNSPTRQFYFKNLHTTDPITVTWTPQGGASNIVQNVWPSGHMEFWTSSTGATAGITALSLLSSSTGGNVPYEMFLGG